MKKKRVDWIITSRKNQDGVLSFSTVGFNKYGCGEIITLGSPKNSEKIKRLINTFGLMLINGKAFEPERIHTIGNNANSYKYKFFLRYFEDDENGKKFILIMPDFDWDIENGDTKLKRLK